MFYTPDVTWYGKHSFLHWPLVIFLLIVSINPSIAALEESAQKNGPEKKTEMLMQRAIVVFRDGVETLIVEPYIKSGANEFVWVLPVPSEPLDIKKSSENLLDVIALATTSVPRKGDRNPFTFFSPVLVTFLFAVFIVVWVKKALANGLSVLAAFPTRYFIFLVFMLLILVWALPNLQLTAGSTSPSNLNDVGYDAVSLNSEYFAESPVAKDGPSLNAWLEAGGMPTLDAGRTKIVDTLGQAGWHFVVARGRAEAHAAMRLCPLSVSFRTSKPVYPVSLTETNTAYGYLDLFILAAGFASMDSFRLQYADEFQSNVEKVNYNGDTKTRGSVEARVFSAQHLPTTFGIPMIRDLMWDGCMLTNLIGRIPEKSAIGDISILIGKGYSYQDYCYMGAWIIKWLLMLSFITVVGLAIFVLAGARIFVLLSERQNQKNMLAAVNLVRTSGINVLILMISIGVVVVSGGFLIIVKSHDPHILPPLRPYVTNAPALPDFLSSSSDDVLEWLKRDPSAWSRLNMRTGGNEDNYFELIRDERGTVLRRYPVKELALSPLENIIYPCYKIGIPNDIVLRPELVDRKQ